MQVDTEKNEIGLFSILTVVVENLRLLIFGPIVAGLIALGIGYALPQSFVSYAILVLPNPLGAGAGSLRPPPPTPVQAASIMVSPIVLDSVIKTLNLSSGGSDQTARSSLSKQVAAIAGKDGLLRLEVTAHTPQDAQAIAKAVLDSWLKSTAPGEEDRAELDKRLVYAKASLESIHKLLERITTGGSSILNKPVTRGEEGGSLIVVGELEARYFAEVLSITKSLQGLSKEVVVVQPTLPSEPSAPKKTLMAIAAALATGVILLILVFALHAWKVSASSPEMRADHAKLLAALKLKGRPD